MKAYELLFITNPSIDDETRLATLKRIDETITSQGGRADEVEEWGKKRLAYEINGLNDGNYILVNFQLEPEKLTELDRVLRITDSVVRYMITRRPKLEEPLQKTSK